MMLTFKQWCEKNGKLHTGHETYEQFALTANQYEKYQSQQRNRQARAEVEKSLKESGIIEDPDIDGGLLG